MNDTYHSTDSEIDIEDDINKPSTSKKRPTRSSNRKRKNKNTEQNWRTNCLHLLKTLWESKDSYPFR